MRVRNSLFRRTVLLSILSISIFSLSLRLAACGVAPSPTVGPTDIPRLPTPRQTVTPATKNVLVISTGWFSEWKRNFNPFSLKSFFKGYSSD